MDDLNAIPKLLSYYLPQFYPIPVNDKWHGPGFTEWTKVRASKSLFLGHDQPRVPHPDLGYYRLDDSETLLKQARLMKTGKISGQIFYHYWFHGEMILERPSQILLGNPEIDMPFAFCWANESWSKRWDGESGEIILKQDYSLDDAKRFIEYLIPFFTDERYIKVSNRPVLFVYRAHDIPALGLMVEIWNSVCLSHGLGVPYLIAVQTGNNLDAANSGFAAEVERPIYSLTEVSTFSDIAPKDFKHAGKVLDYTHVAEMYMKGLRPGYLPVHPGVTVSWDQSPRHASNALILENRSPHAFKRWLSDAMEYSSTYFPPGERFVTINAWNEWAEGAYLEPDSAFAYEFLNASAQSVDEWQGVK